MNKKIVSIIIIILAIATLVAWKLLPSKKITNNSNPTIRIAVNPWIGSGLYYVADEKGFFKDEGLNVTLTDFADGSVGKQLISTDQVDAIVSLTPETIQVLNDAGTKVIVSAVFDTSDGADGIVASAGIQKLSDLNNKTVAYETGSPSHFLFSYLLDQQGMSTKDVKTVNEAAPDAGASFVAGKVDAAVTWEPWLSKAKERKGGHLIASTKDLNILPGMPIFRASVVQQRPQDIQKFIVALFKAENYINSSPNDAYAIIAHRFGIKVSDVTDQLGTFKWLNMQEQKNEFNKNNPNNIYQLIDKAGNLWLKLGLIKTKVDTAAVLDPSILNSINK